MMQDYSNYREILACPFNRSALILEGNRFVAKETGGEYSVINNQPDLRLKREKPVQVNLTLNKRSSRIHDFNYELLTKKETAENNFSGIKVPYHLSAELLSYFPKAKSADLKCLDLGCGTGLHRPICEHAGYKYVGVDYSSKQASLLADAHALPFQDNSFDFVLSIAVLEHIQHPYVMTTEVKRVLKPGGRFIGTVSFLEPFHDRSYYHHTHIGVFNSLEVAGFDIVKIAPSDDWTGLVALATMHLFSSMPPAFVKVLVAPLNLAAKLWWGFKRFTKAEHYHPFDKKYDVLAATGAFAFVADKK